MRTWSLFISGLMAGVALVVACNQGSKAKAAPTDCAVWQVADASDIAGLAGFGSSTVQVGTIENPGYPPRPIYATEIAGWEPFAVQDGTMMARRCKP